LFNTDHIVSIHEDTREPRCKIITSVSEPGSYSIVTESFDEVTRAIEDAIERDRNANLP